VDGRIVITFRATGPGRGLLERGRALDARATAVGGVLVAWAATRVTFAFPPDKLKEAIDLAKPGSGPDTNADEKAWSVGVAQGDLKLLADDGSRGKLAWGPALVAASALAGTAKPGEIVCAQTVRALRSGELLTTGTRMAREGTLRVRGVVVDAQRPWRKQAVEQLSCMRVAPLAGLKALRDPIAPGTLVVLRADPGTGGTRWLTELASAAPRALLLSPAGPGHEPLGALRRALGRSVTRELSPLLLQLAPQLETLLAGNGATVDVASKLVWAFLQRRAAGEATGLVLIDDAKAVDPASLEACVRAARAPSASFAVVARLDASSGLPPTLAALTKGAEIDLAPLDREAAEALAGGCTNDALDTTARKRWARLGGNVPLGIVEAVAYGIVSGDLVWTGDKAKPRSIASGRGKVRGPNDWITLRARDESLDQRTLLALVALLGGEAKVTRIARVLQRAGKKLDVDMTVEDCIRSRWLVDTQEDWVGFPSRTHREALAGLVEDSTRKALHAAAAEVIDEEEGTFGKVDAAWHFAQGGMLTRASPILLKAARATAEGKLEASTTQLIAAARRIDPSCEEAALELLASALARAPSKPPLSTSARPAHPPSATPRKPPSAPPMRAATTASASPPARPGSVPPPRPPSLSPPPGTLGVVPPPPPVPSIPGTPPPAASGVISTHARAGSEPPPVESHDSEPPTIAKLDLPPLALEGMTYPVDETPHAPPAPSPDPPPASSAGTNIATRLGELAKEALLSADNAALERWVDGLSAAGESPIYTERMRAMARLGRGDIGDALRVLRRMRSQLDPKDHRLRCQTSLALGVALSVAGRPQEALLEGLDALARARQIEDEQGAQACIAFLAKLYTSQSRDADADRLRAITPATGTQG
jgi:hypothetical protein